MEHVIQLVSTDYYSTDKSKNFPFITENNMGRLDSSSTIKYEVENLRTITDF
jgi:hypothetical protein